MLRVTELKQWDVVDISNGKNMGAIKDIEIDLSTGVVVAITVSSTESMFGIFGKNNELAIPWKNIVKVGEDVVLVSTENNNIAQEQEWGEEKKHPRRYYKNNEELDEKDE